LIYPHLSLKAQKARIEAGIPYQGRKKRKHRQWRELAGRREALSQFGRACEELGVKVIYAHSPQAKGRIERQFRTFQHRLIRRIAS